MSEGWSYEHFASRVETFDYEQFKPYVDRMVAKEQRVTTQNPIYGFAQSSGTTSERSKFIPVTRSSIFGNHTQGMRDVATLYQAAHPASTFLDGRILTLGGSCRKEGANWLGDLSGLLIRSTSPWSGFLCTPPAPIGLIADFDRKSEAICRHCVKQDIRALAGVPSWNLVLMRAVLAYTGCANIKEVWPRLECFAHGGVSFSPYRETFREMIPDSQMCYMESYNASEGFFAIADDPGRDDMLLMLDYGIFYEFRLGTEIVPLEGVRPGESYALIITSNNGLWRYEIGDRVTFTSTNPYRIRFAGRTRQFINAFGEELIVDNVERALEEVCRLTGARVEEYTVAPRFMTFGRAGAHEWAVEFVHEPDDRNEFARLLDEALRRINSDYDAKRRSTLDPLVLHTIDRGGFMRWMRRYGKNKVPRMMNERRVLEQVLCFEE